MANGSNEKCRIGVLVGDLVDLLVGKCSKLQLVDFGAMGPPAVGVRKVRLPTDIVDIELVEEAHSDWIVDEAAENPLFEHVGRPHAVGNLCSVQPE